MAAMEGQAVTPAVRPLVSAGTLLGIGLGGFVDGIAFHQLLQAHNMLSAWVPKTTIANVEVNMFWDGLFHAATWLATVAGVVLLFHAAERGDVPWSRRVFAGSIALGWGLFNLVEGDRSPRAPNPPRRGSRRALRVDWAFLGSGVLLIGFGWKMIGADVRAATPVPTGARFRPL
jgi:uncharacterized membrane protein